MPSFGNLFGKPQPLPSPSPRRFPFCGCYIIFEGPKYLPLVSSKAHTTIVSSTSRTTLTQTFTTSKNKGFDQLQYVYPLYDGVSVVGFKCIIGDRVINGVVKERSKAKRDYTEAISRGETAGLLEQSLQTDDVFTTTLGNVPAGANIKVEITYLGELKHDAQVDGLRFTVPTEIAPRYGKSDVVHGLWQANSGGGSFDITVDVEMGRGCAIKSIQSPSHPMTVNVGTTSASQSDEPSLERAHATLSQSNTWLEKDIVVQVVATNLGNPSAVLETHPTIPNSRALMATLVPKFNLPADKPEVVFICDRSGSMSIGNKIPDLVAALQIFLKSLPVGVKFNICSFGSHFAFLWERSHTYDQQSLDQAVNHVKTFDANFGGTAMYEPIKETFKRRYKDMNLEVFLMTDGEIWGQEQLFELINDEVKETNGGIRVFTLGVGRDVSSSLIEGVARAGNGFAQTVSEGEKMDKKVVRMLKGALTPHIRDYTLEVKYAKSESQKGSEDENEEDFEIVDKVMDALTINSEATFVDEQPETASQKPISLFDENATAGEDTNTLDASAMDKKYDHLPRVDNPRYLQTPHNIPPLFPFNRTTVYVLFSGSAIERDPRSIVLKGTSAHGPLELEIPVTVLPTKASTIHQLAARKAIHELEEGRGWITQAKSGDGKLLKEKYEGRFSDMVEREAVRLGVEFQVGGKWCSFVAIESGEKTGGKGERTQEMYEGKELQHPARLSQQNAPVSQFASRAMPRMRMAAAAPSSAFPPPPGGGGGTNLRSANTGSTFAASSAVSSYSAAPPGALFGSTDSSKMGGGDRKSKKGFSFLKNSSTDKSRGGGLLSSSSSAAAPASFGAPASQESSLFAAPTGSAVPRRRQSRPQAVDEEENEGFGVMDEGYGAMGGEASASSSPSGSLRAESSAAPTGSVLEQLTALQTFIGSWAWSPHLAKLLGVSQKQASQVFNLSSTTSHQEDITATLCAVAFFKKKLAEESDTWEMIVEKAEAWLADQTDESVQELGKQAEGLF